MTETMFADTFVLSHYKEKITMACTSARADMKAVLLDTLGRKYEGKCSEYGYIRRGSITVQEVSMGIVNMSTFNSSFKYDVMFSAMVFNPAINSRLLCEVGSKNQFGVKCFMMDQGSVLMSIVIPYGLSNAELKDIPMEPTDMVTIKLVGKKFDLGDTTITGVGIVSEDSIDAMSIREDEVQSMQSEVDDEDFIQEDDDEDAESTTKKKFEDDDEDTDKDDDEDMPFTKRDVDTLLDDEEDEEKLEEAGDDLEQDDDEIDEEDEDES
jgi:hypothetical protein